MPKKKDTKMTDNQISEPQTKEKRTKRKRPGYLRRAMGALVLLALVCVIYLMWDHYKKTGRLFNPQDKEDVQRMFDTSRKEADKLLYQANKLSKKALVTFHDAIDVSADKLSELREKIGSEETTQQLMNKARSYLNDASRLLENSDKEVKLKDTEKEFKDSLNIIQKDREQEHVAQKQPKATDAVASDTSEKAPKTTTSDEQKPIQVAMKTPEPKPVKPVQDVTPKKQSENKKPPTSDRLAVAKVEVSGEKPSDKPEPTPAKQPEPKAATDTNWESGRKYFGMGLAHYRKSGPDMKNGYEHLKRATVFFKRAQICLRKAGSTVRKNDEFGRVEIDTNRFLYDCLKRTKVFESR